MEQELRERIERAAETAALFNALKHDSDAQVGAIMGPMMGEHPDFRPHGDEIPGVIAPVIEDVNERSTAEQRERLEELAPERLEELDADEDDDQPLPDLPNVDAYEKVRMRLAPNPNGPWHLGSARMPAVIGTYKQMYDGWMLCRFDDTDPETKRPDLDAYDEILSSIEYLGFEPDDVVKASDRVETYYEYARRLIDEEGAYTCSCDAASFSELKNDGKPCPHREKAPETTHMEFDAMVDGEYAAGEMVLRVRTDIEHKNPALRDWVAFRMVDTPHPRTEAEDYRCWPMLDFQSGIDDHEFGITHIVRGIDLQDSAKRQEFVYEYFEWEYPEVLHWGHVQLDAYDIELSTSTLKKLVADGTLDGWDDPRAPTVASLRRRGIRGEAIVEAMAGLGTSTSNVDLAMSSIYAENRELIDDDADRLFFVRDGIEVPIKGAPGAAEPPVHPDHEDRGSRHIPVSDTVRVEPDDAPKAGETVWLKGLGPVRYDGDAFEFTDDDIGVVREGDVDVIHWVPDDGSVPLRLRTMDGDERGHAEAGVASYDPDDVVQFERIGFARIDRHDGDESVAYFAHP
ncbi:MAG: glutamyl-tRNA synthetase [Natronomonas sp.]|jgi:glutamyl-tRNA synthetase|uniref:glutamate--tRNA ligase n=1 Tax=Natronomonas sp. TaxID=2184060 RepID=UPI003989EAB7